MPELPEVETVRRGLAPHLEGAVITAVEQRRPDLRFPFPGRFVDRLEGQHILSLGRRAKYLLANLASGESLVMHLGMSGSFRVETDVEPPPGTGNPVAANAFTIPRGKLAAHDHVVLHMSGGERVIYNDPRRFGFMTLAGTDALERHPLFAHLGVEPTGNALSAIYLAQAFAAKQAPLKAALLDQKIIAGLGNIYVCEALWRARLSPARAAAAVVRKSGEPTKRLEDLVAAVRDVIREAIDAGGSSLRDHVKTDGSLGYFQKSHAVYGREGEACRRNGCRGIVRRSVQSNRSTFFCGHCQR